MSPQAEKTNKKHHFHAISFMARREASYIYKLILQDFESSFYDEQVIIALKLYNLPLIASQHLYPI